MIGLRVAVVAQTKVPDRAVPDPGERQQVRLVAVGQQQAVTRDDVDEPLKRGLDFSEAAEDVGVVELEVVDDHRLGQVVDELAALVEKRGVVLVALEHTPFAVGEPRALAKVVRDAADEKTGVESIVLQQPGEQGGGGGLAVRAANHERAFAA